MEYDTMTDRFTVRTQFPMKTNLTKRDIVSQLNSVYDPLGIAAPLLVELKTMMREILTTYSSWNDRISPPTCEKWNYACSKINNALITVPRDLLGPISYNQTAVRLWVFADASKLAIATCAYIQSQKSNELSPLVVGRTRLAPKKNAQTIPRLELLGILLAIRMADIVTGAVTNKVAEVHIVTDSEVALCWIKSTRKLPIFVSNQCNRIRNLILKFETQNVTVDFHHVPTSYNPADAGTRGLTRDQISSHAWVRGPQWLIDYPNIIFLRSIDIIQTQEILHEVAEPSAVHVTVRNAPLALEPVFDLS
ncbi:Pao retrotransposon peptidase, partial [Oesophagostomum dentatum]